MSGPANGAVNGAVPADDWTAGVEAIRFERCPTCGACWYFARGRCPACGATEVDRLPSRGEGILRAVSTVTRAPTPELRAVAPYRVALVDMDEGFRMMGHVDDGLAIGDRVRAGYRRLGPTLVPHFSGNPAEP